MGFAISSSWADCYPIATQPEGRKTRSFGAANEGKTYSPYGQLCKRAEMSYIFVMPKQSIIGIKASEQLTKNAEKVLSIGEYPLRPGQAA